ncbi:Spy/CpxP family protein refolding chaperone [Blastochloris viridis]|uniref:LTXXQ motif family protein n=1 Tax=Blastochloris viridis TaxID=1079 RepID=A0A0H5B7L0_BLAVI|nr:Spy/CpxP family protein refolding chaperone [Blastochloris viridis]ALK08552.1 hypothetical protein BVIR_758 [Blastochloris viridis]BAR98160.1 hypothetical protein BV133_567 [Blastochloris viridis]CUU41215.1 hypothetical protein BVIRIDIS_02030 [Blastochloris viridis]
MKITTILLATALAAGATSAYAQGAPGPGGPQRPERAQLNPADRSALVDARIAALKAGLKLTPEQEKLWPAVETAVRDTAAKRQARIDEARKLRDERNTRPDVVERLRAGADRMTDTAADFRRLADAVAPLNATLDDGQKRRLGILLKFGEGHFGPRGKPGPGGPGGPGRM